MKTHWSDQQRVVSFNPIVLATQLSQSEDVDMQTNEGDTESAVADDEGPPAAPKPLTYAHAAHGTYTPSAPSTVPAPPPPPTPQSHQAAVLLNQAEHFIASALTCIEKATNLGGTLSPKLRKMLGNLGSIVNEEELLKKVGDLVESKLAAFSKTAGMQIKETDGPAQTKITTVKSANPVPTVTHKMFPWDEQHSQSVS